MGEIETKWRKGDFESVAHEFVQKVKQIAGPGVDHIYTLNFIQVACLFGFLPLDMTRWACVNSPTSGAYKAINGFFKERHKSLEKNN